MNVVYAMVDPRTDAIFYIGQSSDFPARKAAHLEGSDQLSGYAIKQMKLNGFVPLFVVLEKATTKASALAAEIFWIELMKSRGIELLNAQGVGGHVARGRLRKKLAQELDGMVFAKADDEVGTGPTLEDVANGRSVRARADWTPHEIRRLRGMAKANMTAEAIADVLERAPPQIKRKCKELGFRLSGRRG